MRVDWKHIKKLTDKQIKVDRNKSAQKKQAEVNRITHECWLKRKKTWKLAEIPMRKQSEKTDENWQKKQM